MTAYRLTQESRADLIRLLAVQTKTIGEILREADLVSPFEIESALQDKMHQPKLRLGEILAQKNLIKPKLPISSLKIGRKRSPHPKKMPWATT